MEYLNQYHKESEERKMKKIKDWKKSPADLQKVIANQKERERLTNEEKKQK